MKYSINTLSEAEIDIDDAYIWYEKQQAGLGMRFYESVNDSILLIQKNPFLFEEIYNGTRRCVIMKFPYGIYYKVLADINEVQILGVISFRRHPNIIIKRL